VSIGGILGILGIVGIEAKEVREAHLGAGELPETTGARVCDVLQGHVVALGILTDFVPLRKV
jgi:hypothetical protein